VLAWFMMLMPAPVWAGSSQPASLEYPIKATYLYKFAPFVTWPESAFDSPNSPFVMCIVGEDPFGPLLDQAVAGQRVGQHAIIVRRLQKVDKGASCHILFVGASRGQTAADVLALVKGAPVLTVTDSVGANASVIQFVVQDNRVRFRIDGQAAAQNGLVISSKLLSLALAPRRGG
jgi:hypothetical protein